MDHSSRRVFWCVALILLLVHVHESKTETHYTRKILSKPCEFKTSLKDAAFNKMTTPLAEKLTNSMQNVLIHSNAIIAKGSVQVLVNIADGSSKWNWFSGEKVGRLKKIGKKLLGAVGYLGPALSIICDIVDTAQNYNTPTAEEIMAETQKLIAKLSEEVDRRLEEMKEYIDRKIIALEKELNSNKYKFLMSYWSGCVTSQTWKQNEECQTQAYRLISASLTEFVQFYDILDKTNKTFDKSKLNDESSERMEVNLPNFRNYAYLSLLASKTMETTYGFQLQEEKRLKKQLQEEKGSENQDLPLPNCTIWAEKEKERLEDIESAKDSDGLMTGQKNRPEKDVLEGLYCTYKKDFEDRSEIFRSYSEAVIKFLTLPNHQFQKIPFDVNKITYTNAFEEWNGDKHYKYIGGYDGAEQYSTTSCKWGRTECDAGKCHVRSWVMRNSGIDALKTALTCASLRSGETWKKADVNGQNMKEKAMNYCKSVIQKASTDYVTKRKQVREFWILNMGAVARCWEELAKGNLGKCDLKEIEKEMKKENEEEVKASMDLDTPTPALMAACKRPDTGCRASFDRYKSVDCDGDGILDHVCTTTINNNRWLVLSSEGCPNDWGTSSQPIEKCPNSLACCKTIYVSLPKEAQSHQRSRAGTYHLNGTENDRHYWVSATNTSAIWYIPQYKEWAIGSLKSLGTLSRGICNKGRTNVWCPYDYEGMWEYYDEGNDQFKSTNDMEIRCQVQGLKWYCAVKIRDGVATVLDKSFDLKKAQGILGKGDQSNRHAIIPMTGSEAGDPHNLTMNWNGGSMYWHSWVDIKPMQEECKKATPPVKASSAYLFDKRSMTWKNAQQECIKLGGNLVTVTSYEQNKYLVNELKKRNIERTWIGANDEMNEGIFLWVGSSADNKFTNWRSGEPNGGKSENCVELIPGLNNGIQWNGRWNDVSCARKSPFTCEVGNGDEIHAINAWSSSVEGNRQDWYGPQLAWKGGSNNNKGFFHSATENNPWLKIELNKQARISTIIITNRKDCCRDRLQNLEIRGGMQNDLTNPLIAEFKGPGQKTRGIHRFQLKKPADVKFLSFQLKKNNGVLQINGIQLGVVEVLEPTTTPSSTSTAAATTPKPTTGLRV